MITFREDQIATLAEITPQSFRQKLHGYLAETFSDFCALPIEKRETFLAAAFRQAPRHGLQTEGPLLSYVLASWFLGPNFTKADGAASEVLASPELSEYEKAVWLDDYTVSHLPG
jgi:hypothetical protein